MIAAYRDPDRAGGREQMRSVIDALPTGIPTPLTDLRTLGRTLAKRAQDVLAYFDRPAPATDPPKPSTAASSIYAA